MQTFMARSLEPGVLMTAMDADVIKTYVAAGLGVSVVQAAVMTNDAIPECPRWTLLTSSSPSRSC